MYDTTRHHFYQAEMTDDIYNTVAKCISCTRNCRTNKNQTELQLFPPAGPFDFVAISILVSLPKTKGGNIYIVVATDRFTKLPKSISAAKTTAKTMAYILIKDCVANLGVSFTVGTDNGPQFISKFFNKLCKNLSFKTEKGNK